MMKNWRLVLFYILMLAIPTSNFASVTMASHCQTSDNTSDSMHAQMDHSQHVQMQDHSAPQDIDNHNDCECGCNGEINCSVSGCSAAALTNFVGTTSINSTQFKFQGVTTLAFPPDPNLLFRPPISLS